MVRLLNLLNLTMSIAYVVANLPSFLHSDEVTKLFEIDGADFNTTFPLSFSKHVWYGHLILQFHLAFLHFCMFLLASPYLEKLCAVGHIIYYAYGQLYLHENYPLGKDAKWSMFKCENLSKDGSVLSESDPLGIKTCSLSSPAAYLMYWVPLVFVFALVMDMTTEFACVIVGCCGKKIENHNIKNKEN